MKSRKSLISLIFKRCGGADNTAEMMQRLEQDVYAVKFNYHSGSPGYVGDYYILQGDALGEAVELIRDHNHKLKLI
jgi:hypothetical protein